MSGGISFGATITGGIQNIARLLPLLGTQQCEEHIGSALTKGYLYAAATPMSIFGSLGVARAGFKTLIACMSGRTWSGATILANMGFEPKGSNLSLVMIDKDDKDGRHLAETRLDELAKELHIDMSRVTVSHKCTQWNVTMLLLTAFFSSLSIIPYIHINLRGSNLTHFNQWTFPILRTVGGFLTASMMQIVIEMRIGTLTTHHLAKFNKSEPFARVGESPGEVPGRTNNAKHPPVVDVTQESQGETRSDAGVKRAGHTRETGDIEKALAVDPASDDRPAQGRLGDKISSQHDAAIGRTGTLYWVSLVLLLAGILSSVVGFVGCFSVVQNAKSRTGPLSWLCLEAGLSVLRMILWGLNPRGDDAPPLELVLRLDHNTILPTCNQDDDSIMRQRVLPLTRANKFLNMVTSFAGLVERFTHPDLTLYYTLTRKTSAQQAGKRVLYITIFDHKECTTRVYTREGTTERFYSTESDVPLIDLRHGLLETKLHSDISSKDDVITGDPEIHSLLRIHYQSIMDQIHFTIGETHHDPSTSIPLPPACIIENKWTMKAADTVGTRERRRRGETVEQGSGRTWGFTVERGRTIELDGSQPTFERDRLYFEHGRIEDMRQSLDAARGRWIDMYMDLVTSEERDCLEGETTAMRRVNGEPAENEGVVGKKAPGGDEILEDMVEEELIDERCLMEMLLVFEVEVWEGLVWTRVQEFIGRNDIPESDKGRLTEEWRGNCWRRLDTNIHAMDVRLERVKERVSALPDDRFQWRYALESRLETSHNQIRSVWQSVLEKLAAPTPSFSPRLWINFDRGVRSYAKRPTWRGYALAQERERRLDQEMIARLKKEVVDIDFRVAQGLDRCDQFFDDEDLLESRHSRSKSLVLIKDRFKAPLDFYSRALKGNAHVIRIVFICRSGEEYAWFAETICVMPSVTTIRVHDPQQLPSIRRDAPLFTSDIPSRSLEALVSNKQSLARTCDTYVFMAFHAIAVSFVGPSSGNLILRLKHYVDGPEITLTLVGSSLILTIPQYLTIDDIHLHPLADGDSICPFSFTPNIRNHLILKPSSLDFYTLQDIQLLDGDGNPHGQHFKDDTSLMDAELDAIISFLIEAPTLSP